MPGGVPTAQVDPTLTAHYLRENPPRPGSTGPQQFLRLRRDELQSRFWACPMKVAAYVGGVGVLGPGLADWEDASAVLSGARAYEPHTTVAAGTGAAAARGTASHRAAS